MGFLRKQQQDESQRTSASADTLPTADIPVDIPGIDPEKGVETYKPKLLTAWTLTMTILAAMAGFVFGYDTGQISGFLEMPVFLERFGQQHADGTYYFSNVRSGLIVGLVSLKTLLLLKKTQTNASIALHRNSHWLSDRSSSIEQIRTKMVYPTLVSRLCYWSYSSNCNE